MSNISGAVGYTLLRKNLPEPFYILLFADIHDGVEYCQKDTIMIDTLLGQLSNNNVLLEEAPRTNFTLTELWPNAPHTQKLKELNHTNQRITPVDIRPYLIPYSWELFGMKNDVKETHGKMKFNDYLKILNDILNNCKFPDMLKKDIGDLCVGEKDTHPNLYNISIFRHFKIIAEEFNKFKTDNKDILDKSMSEIFTNHKDVLENVNNLNSNVMEWYILLLVYNSKKNAIIHVGLAHSERILDILTKTHQFMVEKQVGRNKLNNFSNMACVYIPPEVLTKFSKIY